MEVLRNKVTPCKGRELVVTMLDASFDYKGRFDSYGLKMTGLVPNARAVGSDETRVNHMWRFVRRCDPCVKYQHNFPHRPLNVVEYSGWLKPF